VRGDRNATLKDWLWDFDARPLEPAERKPPVGYARDARKGFRSALRKQTSSGRPLRPEKCQTQTWRGHDQRESPAHSRWVWKCAGLRPCTFGAKPRRYWR
jgi:hypothetical protein